MTRKLTNAEYEKWQGLEYGDPGDPILPAPKPHIVHNHDLDPTCMETRDSLGRLVGECLKVKDQGASGYGETPEWVEEHRWVPVSQSGRRWAGRSLEAALSAKEDFPAGGAYSDGEDWDGITHIEHEARRVTPWQVLP